MIVSPVRTLTCSFYVLGRGSWGKTVRAASVKKKKKPKDLEVCY